MISRGPLSDFVCNANEVTFIKLINDEQDLNDLEKDSFHPEFTHQFFGDNENIFGYRQLKVYLLYTGSRLNSYLGLKYAERYEQSKLANPNVTADDVMKIIAEKSEGHYCYNLDEFSASLNKEHTFKPYGQLIHSFQVNDVSNENGDNKRWFEIFKSEMSNPGFRAYHERMQTFLLWFVDSASYIDTDDDRWDYFLIYEKLNQVTNVVSNGQINSFVYRFVGYATIYRYYAYPQKIRPRISQFIVLPPFQKRGLGAELLSTINNFYSKDPNVLDITVEDPSDDFIRLRDFINAKNCMNLESFKPEKLKNGWNEAMANQAQEQFKINKKQARKAYEILRLKNTNLHNDEEYKSFRIDVKQRLNAPFERQRIDQNKLLKSGLITAAELKATLLPKDVRIEQLDNQYKQLEKEYKHIIERLA